MTHAPTALELHEQIKSGQRSAVEVLEEAYQRIDALNPRLNAFNSQTRELGTAMAREVDRKVAAKESLPLLAGVPIAVKDNLNVKDYPTTCSSKILAGYISPYDATVVEKLRHNLLPIVGKTNLDEFAMGSSNENSALGVVRNPWDPERVPGGSSGGSAVAVSAGQTAVSLGSDTGGSVRQPAALCGLVGIKPTYGLVSRYGLVAFASSLDQISPFARTVKDAAAVLQVIQGFDPKDSTSIHPAGQTDYLAAIDKPVDNLRVGIIAELDGEGMQAEVARSFQQAVKTFEKLGATIKTISLPSIRHAVASYYIIATAEASSNLARFDGVRYGLRVGDQADIHTMYRKTRSEGFGPEVKRRIMLGTFALSSGYYDAYYGKAQKVRELMKLEIAAAWKDVDVLICPTSPTTAFKIGEKSADPVSMYLSDIATIPVNLAGIPAISIPCGFDDNHLPIGLQILGPHQSEAALFRVATMFERETGLTNLQPDL